MYYVNPSIKDLYRIGCEESRRSFLRLDMNENPKGLPENVVREILSEISSEDIAMYPENYELIKTLANYLKCSQENICLTNGSDDAIRLVFDVYGEPGSKFVSVAPSFEMYSVYNNMHGMEQCSVYFDEKFEISVDKVLEAIDKGTSIVTLLNPNSPIGRAWTIDEVVKIVKRAEVCNAIVVIDEAYHHFYKETYLDLFREYNNVMIFRTFSKLFSIAGCRIGYVVSNKENINFIKRASSSYPVNFFAIRFAEKLLQNPDMENALIKKENEGREWLINKLKEFDYEYSFNGGNYILIKSNNDPKVLHRELKKRRILIKVYNSEILRDWIRITTGDKEVMEKFWDEFKNIDF